MTAAAVRKALRARSSAARAKSSAWFFKTGPGQYGAGDVFVGVSVPDQRRIAKGFRDLPLSELEKLLASKVHEERLTALIILTDQYTKADDAGRRARYRFYVKNLQWVNNWDLVDTSAATIVGGELAARSRKPLYRWAKSKNLWERRVAIIATFRFIRDGEAAETFRIAEMLIGDREDLIHKAVGWMLREVGKRVSQAELRRFLTTHAATMPRTALRYAIEHFPPAERKRWLAVRQR